MPDLYLKKCTCPYCLKTTETKRVLSRISVSPRRTLMASSVIKASTSIFTNRSSVAIVGSSSTSRSESYHQTFGRPYKITSCRRFLSYRLPGRSGRSSRQSSSISFVSLHGSSDGAKTSDPSDAWRSSILVASFDRSISGRTTLGESSNRKYVSLYENYTSVKESGIPEDVLWLRIADLYAVTKDKEHARLWYSRLFQSQTATDKVKKDARTHWEWVQEQD